MPDFDSSSWVNFKSELLSVLDWLVYSFNLIFDEVRSHPKVNMMNDKLVRLLSKPFDFIFNRRIKRYALGPNAINIIGDRGVGKSTIFALISEISKKNDYPVYCQYPYKGAYKIPVVEKDMGEYRVTNRVKLNSGKWYEQKEWHEHKVWNVDKDWLYGVDFQENSVLLLDEARTIWPARNYQNWTISDDEFFNFLRKAKLHVYISSQENDALDLNVRRAADEVWFLWKKNERSSFTHIDVYRSRTVPIENLDKRVKLSKFSGELYQLDWDICGALVKSFIFFRPPYYGLFDTNFFYHNHKPEEHRDSWNI